MDATRNSLVTAFVCTDCGSNLSLSYRSENGKGSSVDNEPTGADMVKSVIYIHPCKKCLEPVAKVKQSIKNLLAL